MLTFHYIIVAIYLLYKGTMMNWFNPR